MPQQPRLWRLGQQLAAARDRVARHPDGAHAEPGVHGAPHQHFPANRLGPGGDVAKVNCATCHQGAHKPLYGAEMAKHHPELLTKSAPVAAAAGTLTAGDVKVLQQAVPVSTAAK